MKKENKKLAQQRRAVEKKKQKRKNIIEKICKWGIPAIVLLAFIWIMVADPFSSSDSESDNSNDTNTETTSTDNTSDETNQDDASGTYTPAALDENLTYYADIDIADYGKITVKLDQKSAPITAANFVALANDGFYNGLTFHRIIEGFMMQGGDPNGNGTGGSENNIVGEFKDNGYENNLSHTRGAISMARSSDPNSASSQFFIVHEDNPASLDNQYAAFGYVTEGMDVVDMVCETAEPTDGNGTIAADAQPVINSISIRTE